MKHITLEQTQKIINGVGLPCADPKALMNSLNVFIKNYETIKDLPSPNRRTEINTLKRDKKELLECKRTISSELLGAYALLENYKEKIMKRGLSSNDIKSCSLTLITLLEIVGQEINHVSGVVDKSIDLKFGTPAHTFKNVFLCGILPKIYEEHFKRKFGISRSSSTNTVGGPSIRFVKIVSEYMNLDMSESAIEKAWKRFRA